MKKHLFAFALIVCSGLVQANHIPTCLDLNLYQMEVGQSCLTEKDGAFTRVKVTEELEAWKDEQGLLWSDWMGKANHYVAMDECALLGMHLPSKSEYKLAVEHGLKQIDFDFYKRPFWGTEIHDGGSMAHVHHSSIRGQYGFRRGHFSYRCVK